MKCRVLYAMVVAMLLLVAMPAQAQKMPERGLVRKGNRMFSKELYHRSSEAYQAALMYDSTLFEGRYNLANALLRQAMADTTAMQDPQSAQANMSAGYLSQAEGLLKQAAVDSLQSDEARADAYYNLGNTQFVQQKLQEALQSYRRALTLRPDDMEAKYNYALTKKLLEQNQNQNQDQNQQNDQNQNQNQDQNKDQNQNQNQDPNKDNGGDDKKDQKQDPDSQDQNDQKDQKQNRSGMSEDQQQQLLDAIQAEEDKTQDKLDKKGKAIVVKGRKNW